MLDEKDLQAIAQLMDLKMAQQKKEILEESAANMRAILEGYVEPKFNLLADGLAAVNEKLKALPDPDLMDWMQEELDLHHELLKLHTREINALKRAQ